MENPFDKVIVKKPRVKRKYTLKEMMEFFPQESKNSIELKLKMAKYIKEKFPNFSDFKTFDLVQGVFNKYFYTMKYESETKIEDIINDIPEFDLFKRI